MTNHFLLIEVGMYDASMIFGVYDSFEEAREDAERRTIEVGEIEKQRAANRHPGQIGDPGPYPKPGESGIQSAQIQQWDGSTAGKVWERTYSKPNEWRSY